MLKLIRGIRFQSISELLSHAKPTIGLSTNQAISVSRTMFQGFIMEESGRLVGEMSDSFEALSALTDISITPEKRDFTRLEKDGHTFYRLVPTTVYQNIWVGQYFGTGPNNNGLLWCSFDDVDPILWLPQHTEDMYMQYKRAHETL